MSEQQKTFPCIDVYKHGELKQASDNGKLKAVFLKGAIWKPNLLGNRITITFGSMDCPGCSPEAAWSYIGSDSNSKYPSMNLGFCDPPLEDFIQDGKLFTLDLFRNATRNYCTGTICNTRWTPGATILHEFGHALGMFHEHQNFLDSDSNPLVFNRDGVIQYYLLLGYDYSQAVDAADNNVLERYECTNSNCPYEGSSFDSDSIMIYSVPDSWVEGDNPTYPNFKYSITDKNWLSQEYPLNATLRPEIEIEFLDGEEWQKYWVKKTILDGLAPIVGIDFSFKDLPNDSTVTPAPSPHPAVSRNKKLINFIVIVSVSTILIIILSYYLFK